MLGLLACGRSQPDLGATAPTGIYSLSVSSLSDDCQTNDLYNLPWLGAQGLAEVRADTTSDGGARFALELPVGRVDELAETQALSFSLDQAHARFNLATCDGGYTLGEYWNLENTHSPIRGTLELTRPERVEVCGEAVRATCSTRVQLEYTLVTACKDPCVLPGSPDWETVQYDGGFARVRDVPSARLRCLCPK
jgi:hypothetical protein